MNISVPATEKGKKPMPRKSNTISVEEITKMFEPKKPKSTKKSRKDEQREWKQKKRRAREAMQALDEVAEMFQRTYGRPTSE
jgi:hypothetical protein